MGPYKWSSVLHHLLFLLRHRRQPREVVGGGGFCLLGCSLRPSVLWRLGGIRTLGRWLAGPTDRPTGPNSLLTFKILGTTNERKNGTHEKEEQANKPLTRFFLEEEETPQWVDLQRDISRKKERGSLCFDLGTGKWEEEWRHLKFAHISSQLAFVPLLSPILLFRPSRQFPGSIFHR